VNIQYRKAVIEDSSFLLSLRNQKSVRLNSRNSTEIAEDSHVSWFKKRLKEVELRGPILVFSLGNSFIGYSRIDLLNQNSAILSFALDIEYRNMGLGRSILQLTLGHATNSMGIKAFEAVVSEENFASRRIFQICGFRELSVDQGWIRMSLQRA
jgi:RimJ/RimL family protein N-acetyltransferase